SKSCRLWLITKKISRPASGIQLSRRLIPRISLTLSYWNKVVHDRRDEKTTSNVVDKIRVVKSPACRWISFTLKPTFVRKCGLGVQVKLPNTRCRVPS